MEGARAWSTCTTGCGGDWWEARTPATLAGATKAEADCCGPGRTRIHLDPDEK